MHRKRPRLLEESLRCGIASNHVKFLQVSFVVQEEEAAQRLQAIRVLACIASTAVPSCVIPPNGSRRKQKPPESKQRWPPSTVNPKP